jgi:GNAT superfamily N-acetyltransferase
MGGDATFDIVAVSKLTGEQFDRFYRTVLEPAFPPEELEDIDVVRTAHYQPGSDVPGVAALRAADPVGGALGEHYRDGNVVLLDYLAVRSECRGSGIGGVLLERALSTWRELLDPAAILAEIEDPRGRSAGSHGDPHARVRFYDRAGAKALPLQYVQPAVRPGAPRVRGMFLICLDPWREWVPKAAVLAFLDEYMEAAEGREAATADPEYLNLRGEVDSWPVEIPLVPLSRVAELPASGQQATH